MNNLSFTRHAILRIIKGGKNGLRTKLTVNEVRSIITNPEKSLPFGMEGKKKYILFYSKKDDNYYIVVMDQSTQEVITVMSLNTYADRIPVSQDMLQKARNLVDPNVSTHEVPDELDKELKSLDFLRND